MENKYLYQVFPFLKRIDKKRRKEFEHYFQNAPMWLLDSFQIEDVGAGKVFVKENAPVDTIYFIGEGSIRALDYSVDGITHEFMRFDKVYAMGGMEILMDMDRYGTTLQTVTPCTIAKISKSKFERWLSLDALALKREAKLMGRYLLEQGRESRLYLFLQGADRLAMLLARRYERFEKDGVLKLGSTRQDLSDATGLCVKTINRAIKKLEAEGTITRDGHDIYINKEQYMGLREIVSRVATPYQ